MYQFIPLHPCGYLWRFPLNECGDWSRKWSKWNLNAKKKLKLEQLSKVGCEYELKLCLIAWSVRAPDRNSVVVGPYPTQPNFPWLPGKIPQWWIPYTYIYIYIIINYLLLWVSCYSCMQNMSKIYKENNSTITSTKWLHIHVTSPEPRQIYFGLAGENGRKTMIIIKCYSITNDIHVIRHFQVICGIWRKVQM